MNQLKILYHHRIASKDGQYIHLSAIVREFKKAGHDVYLSGPDLEESSGMGGQKEWVHFLKRNIPKFIYEPIEFGYSIADFFRLAIQIKKYKPDFIYERANLFFISGIWAAKVFNLKLILEVNAPLYNERATYDGVSLKAFAKWTEDYTWKNADYVLPVTNVLAKMIKDRVQPKNLRVIHNGISPDDLTIRVNEKEMRTRMGLMDKKVIGFVGFVRNWHKLDRIIDFIASKQDDKLCLMIVGEGPDCENLIEHAKKRGVSESLVMVGLVQRELMASYINLFDIAIQSAVTAYASPLKLFEYLYLEKIIVAPDMENIREILNHEENSFLFDDSDNESLIQALEQALDADHAEITKKAGETIGVKEFLWCENARKITDIFNNDCRAVL